jgi:crotonobetainyl-CoA:carnitine CoA-transferase CaiB-like acyl-CoA transferase
MLNSPLKNIRILDFSRVLAGPLCTMMLADLGADVIKVEQPYAGDDTRQWGPPWLGSGDQRQSAYFLSVNRNKRSLTLNLKAEQGRAVARQLAAQCDIVVENFKVGQMAGFGLAYTDLKARNPRLVYCSITGYGQTGLYRDRPGYDYVVQAMSGLMSITGEPDGAPQKVGVALADVIAGLNAANAIQAALRHAEQTGEGQYIDIALLDTQIAALVNIASNYLVSGMNPTRLGSQHPNIVPYQTFRAADGDFVLAVGNDQQFRQLCHLIDQPELAQDERYATNPARVQHRAALIRCLEAIFTTRRAAEWVERLLQSGIPAGPINDIATIMNDPHIESRGLIQEMPLTNGDHFRFVGSPLHLSQTPPTVRLPPPLLGQHTDEVLRDLLGMDDDGIAACRAEGII